jgi:peptide chain release factor 1
MLPLDRLDQIVSRFQFLEAKLNEELSGADIAKVSREYAELRPVVEEIIDYKGLLSALKDVEELLADPDMKALAEDELTNQTLKIPKTEQSLQLALLPKDSADARPAILEIRPGTGGEESALFAGNLLRMYQRYAEINNWSFEMIEEQQTARRLLPTLRAMEYLLVSNMKVACIECKEYQKLRVGEGFTLLQQLLPYYLKLKT